MSDPRIVFCENNHIYDASLYESCPYCRKIALEQKELNESVRGKMKRRARVASPAAEDDYTELLQKNGNKEDDFTELISLHKDDFCQNNSSQDSDDYTELIKRDAPELAAGDNYIYEKPTKVDAHFDQGNIVGWLVIKSGTGKGHSLEICEKTRTLYLASGRLETGTSDEQDEIALVDIWWDDVTYITAVEEQVLKVNGIPRNKISVLRNYDTISVGDFELVYVELMVQLMGWNE